MLSLLSFSRQALHIKFILLSRDVWRRWSDKTLFMRLSRKVFSFTSSFLRDKSFNKKARFTFTIPWGASERAGKRVRATREEDKIYNFYINLISCRMALTVIINNKRYIFGCVIWKFKLPSSKEERSRLPPHIFRSNVFVYLLPWWLLWSFPSYSFLFFLRSVVTRL